MSALHNEEIKVAVVGRNLSTHFYNFLESKGYKLQFVPSNNLTYPPVNNHPDLYGTPLPKGRWLLEPTLFDLIKERFKALDPGVFYRGERLLGVSYPETCIYNHLTLRDRLIGSKSCLHPQVITLAKKSHLKIEPVKQGYVRCTTAFVGENIILTSDKGIMARLHRLKEEEPENFETLEILWVEPTKIKLSGFSHGFIGGSLIPIDNHLVYCYGNPRILADYSAISALFKRQHIELVYDHELEMEDVGSALLLTL